MRQVFFKRQPEYPDIEREYTRLDARLYPIIELLDTLTTIKGGSNLVVTRIWEPKDDGSTHHKYQPARGPYRFIDIAVPERLSPKDAESIRAVINTLYPRGDSKPTVPPLDHGTARHYHLQVAIPGRD